MGLLKQKISFLFLIILLPNCLSTAQQQDTTDIIPVQYRRGVELQNGYQTYQQKYSGKDLADEKRRLFPLQSTGVWTELNPKVPRVDYIGIHFVNVDTGWAVGDLGALIKTTDGGLNWITEETNTTTPLLKVNSFNGQIVIASGFSGLILRSTDGGDSWSQITSGVTGDLWGLQMINDTLGWACGTNNSLIKTTDRGISWQTVTIPGYTNNYWWIDFLNENYGLIAGDGKVLRTTNGGNNWEIIQAGDSYPLFCINVIDSMHIAAAGYGGPDHPSAKNIYSSDGGNTWIDGGDLQAFAINCISYINTDTGYISMNEAGLWKTTNRGQNWVILDSVYSNYMGEYEIQLFNEENIGYDAGSGLRIYKAEGNLDSWHKSIINDDLSDVYFTNEQKGFVISPGLNGNLYETTNGGINWQPAPGPSGYCLLFTDSLTGYIGSTNSKIYKTTSGGAAWYQTNGIINPIAKIFFTNHQTGWAVGGPRIFKTTDAGENWSEMLNIGTDSFTSIFFEDSLNGWTTSRYIWQTTDGGYSWTERTDIPTFFGKDIYFTANMGFTIEMLTLYKSTDNGNNWFTQLSSQYVIRSFGWLSNSHGFIIGDGVYETIDGGNTWNEILELRNIGLRKLQSPMANLGYSSGFQGLIYKYIDTTYTPVEISSFTAKTDDESVKLNWTTSTETNNKGFEVERFDEALKTEWEKIGYVEGYGTTTEPNSYSFTDENVTTGTYKYRLKQIDFNGNYKYSQTTEVNLTAPEKFLLEQNYPNPFNPETTIKYSIPVREKVELTVFDVLGREVQNLVNEIKDAGNYEVSFDAEKFVSGVYIYRLKSGNYIKAFKMILLK